MIMITVKDDVRIGILEPDTGRVRLRAPASVPLREALPEQPARLLRDMRHSDLYAYSLIGSFISSPSFLPSPLPFLS